MFIILAIRKRLRSIIPPLFVLTLLGLALLCKAPIADETSRAGAVSAESVAISDTIVADGLGDILSWLTCYVGSCGME